MGSGLPVSSGRSQSSGDSLRTILPGRSRHEAGPTNGSGLVAFGERCHAGRSQSFVRRRYSFDRTVSRTAASKTTVFTYLGMDNQVLREEIAGKAEKSYQYAPWGQQLTRQRRRVAVHRCGQAGFDAGG